MKNLTASQMHTLLAYYHGCGVGDYLFEGAVDHTHLPVAPYLLKHIVLNATHTSHTGGGVAPSLPQVTTHAKAAPVASPVKPATMMSPSMARPIATPKPAQQSSHSLNHLPALKACQTVDELKALLLSTDGCLLKKTAKSTVFGDGNLQSKIMIVGEAPGDEEDQQGLPFVGQSGQLLTRMLEVIGLKRDDIYITNVIPWRPPGNRPPNVGEVNFCLPFLEQHINIIKPKVLILLGGTPVKALLRLNDGVLKLRGHGFAYHADGRSATKLTPDGDLNLAERAMAVKSMMQTKKDAIVALPTLHPSYVMRSPSQKRLVWRDLVLLKKILSV